MADFKVTINSEVYQLIPYGYCACGCGEKTKISPETVKAKKYVKGQPRKYINGHNSKISKYHPSWKGGKTFRNNGYTRIHQPNHPRADSGKYVQEHILVIEKVLGKPLPIGAVPHHVNGNRADNHHYNLVLCQDNTYHMLLEKRTRAYKACGHANWLKCKYCKQYDDPINMYVSSTKRDHWHRKCHCSYNKERYHRKHHPVNRDMG